MVESGESTNKAPESRNCRSMRRGCLFSVIPAIDLKDGRCVRLRQGRADDATVYSEDPVAMAKHWVDEGARYIHIVDLDGAFQGHPVHLEAIQKIIEAVPVSVEVGGGIRTDHDIRAILKLGADRVIIGTRAFARPDGLKRLSKDFGTQLAVGIDACEGRVVVKGWVEATSIMAVDLAETADNMGIQTIIYTDTSRDGMLGGPNIKAVAEICGAVRGSVIASGGISSEADLSALLDIGRANLVGAIVGKALYENKVSLRSLNAIVG